MNPYLPSKEYIPDGEPHVFSDRLYIYGSHDRFNGTGYCEEPYVAWSTPVDNLGDWRYEGVILDKGLDPLDETGQKSYYAPDVAQGPDGRYYLYYSIEESSVISVAVCDTPAGKYQFYGYVKDASGHVLGSSSEDPFQYDPAVLVDGEHIYLYSGQNTPVPGVEEGRSVGSLVCELDKDMVTAITPQIVLTSGRVNTFIPNPFFEASSIRKFGDKYYFIYSPLPNVHNLCYAISDYPDRGFCYEGVLVSNADITADVKDSETMSYWGNNHGSLVEINGEYYIFYHRHTNKSGWCRQGCAEKIHIRLDGTFEQAQLTSTGMSDIMPAIGTYGCYTACHLRGIDMKQYRPFVFQTFDDNDPYFTQEEDTEEQYIANFRDGATADFRYFYFNGTEQAVEVVGRGTGNGVLRICAGEHCGVIAEIEMKDSINWKTFTSTAVPIHGVQELRMVYEGTGHVDLLTFQFM